MESEIKRGDIVIPTSSHREKEFGVGVVVNVDRTYYPFTVVFPSVDKIFNLFSFDTEGLKLVDNPNPKEYREVLRAGFFFDQMQGELRRA